MIPISLEVTNFLSYRTKQTLDLSVIDLACIAGQNGAGKSSLLEAITWALFNRSRTRSDDDIVNRVAARNGERAEVQFVFSLEGATYRVIRRKKAGGRMVLEFQLQRDGENWTSLTETKIRETQAAIENTLGMGYDTFVNVSFFLQGKADEFTTKTAGQRKELLAELLGVNKWDVYKERATEKRKSAENELALLDARVQDIDTELLEAGERTARLSELEATLKRISAQLETQTLLLNQLRRAADNATSQEKEVERREQQVTREEKRLTDLRQTLQLRETERAQFQALIDQGADILARFAQFEAVSAELDALQKLADEFNRIQQAMRPHELAIERERSRLTQRKSELTSQQQRVATMRDERDALGTRLADRREEAQTLGKQSAELTEQTATYQAAREQLQALLSERRLQQQQADQLTKQAAQIADTQKEKTKLETELAAANVVIERLEKEIEQLDTQRTALVDLQTRHRFLLTVEQPRLRAQVDKYHERIKKVESVEGGECPFCGRPLTGEHLEQVIAETKNEGAPYADDWRNNKRIIAEMQPEIRRLETAVANGEKLEKEVAQESKRVNQIEARLAEIARGQTAWQESGGAEQLAALQKQLSDDAAEQSQQKILAELEPLIKEKPAVDKRLRELDQSVSRLETRLDEIDKAVAAWDADGESALAAVTDSLDKQNFEAEARSALAALQKESADLAYDPAHHQSTRQLRDSLRDVVAKKRELEAAEAAVKPLTDTIADLENQIAGQELSSAEMRQELEDARAQLIAFREEAKDLRPVEDTVFQMRRDQNEANRKVGVSQQRVTILEQQRERRKTLMGQREELTLEIQQLKMLEKACGRDGIQALLIERALPEIEDSANELLDRLTDGVMRVAFETQRQLKTSDALRETLDIRILDGSGERPYENYSGGEQFRINFAIRLALSKILAKRSGARLQTLVIDEGFGSQDPSGRQRLIEAIKTIEQDFACILVITHVEELRDAFPVKIEVIKSVQGSQIRVSEV